MARGIRRTKEQMIAELEAKLSALKNEAVLDPEHSDVKKVVEAVVKAADSNGWQVRQLLKVVTDKLVVKQTRTRKPKAA